jgi:hypothetical protein
MNPGKYGDIEVVKVERPIDVARINIGLGNTEGSILYSETLLLKGEVIDRLPNSSREKELRKIRQEIDAHTGRGSRIAFFGFGLTPLFQDLIKEKELKVIYYTDQGEYAGAFIEYHEIDIGSKIKVLDSEEDLLGEDLSGLSYFFFAVPICKKFLSRFKRSSKKDIYVIEAIEKK